MPRRLLCMIGLHCWDPWEYRRSKLLGCIGTYRRCISCGKERKA